MSEQQDGSKSTTETGVVKFFNDILGWGFITPASADPEPKDVFVHYGGIAGTGKGRRSLAEGDRVHYNITQGPKGPQATEVCVRSAEEA